MTKTEEVLGLALGMLAAKYIEDAYGEWPVDNAKAQKLAVEFIHKAERQIAAQAAQQTDQTQQKGS